MSRGKRILEMAKAVNSVDTQKVVVENIPNLDDDIIISESNTIIVPYEPSSSNQKGNRAIDEISHYDYDSNDDDDDREYIPENNSSSEESTDTEIQTKKRRLELETEDRNEIEEQELTEKDPVTKKKKKINRKLMREKKLRGEECLTRKGVLLTAEKERHLALAEKAYEEKRADKEYARNSENQRVIVFDLQQNLPTPLLTTSEVYYKRQFWTYNFTMRDCCTESTTCFMWHEGLSDRGADQIASCIIHFLRDLPNNIDTVIFYSDSCPGQNKNTIVAAALSWFLSTSKYLKTIEHKFLEVGHSRLECDSDHAKIERAKKDSSEMEIRIPHDWHQFVRSIRGKKKFKVVEMQKEDFLQYSALLRSVFVKRDRTESGENIRWHDIKVLRFSKDLGPGVVQVKYSHDENEGFCRFNLKRSGTNATELKPVYNGPKPINPKKKEDLLDLLKYIDPVYHTFYRNLAVNENAEDVV